MDLPGRTGNLYKGDCGKLLTGIADSQQPMNERMCVDQPGAQDWGCFGATGVSGELFPPRYIQYDIAVENELARSRFKTVFSVNLFPIILVIIIMFLLFKFLR